MSLPSYSLNRPTFPEMYERSLVQPLFRPFAEVLLQRVGLRSGQRVLDIACGTGIVARLARERLGDSARVVGVDLSAPMLAIARAVAPDIDWREGIAGALPLGSDELFDAVLCHQGLQFFSDRPAAACEMRRVLAPNGALAIATWRPVEEIPFFRELHAVAVRHIGPIVDQRHCFGDATAIKVLLTGAGFRDVRVETVSRMLRFADHALVGMNAMALVGMSQASKTMDEEARARAVAAIIEDSAAVLPPYSDGKGLAFELSTNVATGKG